MLESTLRKARLTCNTLQGSFCVSVRYQAAYRGFTDFLANANAFYLLLSEAFKAAHNFY